MPGSTVSLNIAVREKSFPRSSSVFDDPTFPGIATLGNEPRIPQPTGGDVIGASLPTINDVIMPPVPTGSEILLRQNSTGNSNLSLMNLGGVVQSNSFSSSYF